MNVKISKHPSRILVTLSHFSRERPIYDCSQIRRSRLIGRCSERHWRATRNTNRSKTSREMISVGVQNCFSPTGDRPGSFRRIETNVVRPSLSLSLSFSIANENENEPLGCAIIHWRRWLRLRHTYRISSSSAAEPSNKTRQPEIRRISSELFFFFFPPSLPPSFLFSASFQAERSAILWPVINVRVIVPSGTSSTCFGRLMTTTVTMDRSFVSSEPKILNANFRPFPREFDVVQRVSRTRRFRGRCTYTLYTLSTSKFSA